MMHSEEPASTKFKRVCMDLTNLTIITKNATPGGVHVTFGHAYVGNKYPGGNRYRLHPRFIPGIPDDGIH